MDFISLHNHTHFSILDSLADPKELFKRAKELGQSAIAITDHATFAGAWDCLKLSKEIGIKLIIGCEFYFLDDAKNKDKKFRHLILIAKNAIGYKNLLTLNYEGFKNNDPDSKRVYSVIDWKLLEQYSEGLICLTACGNGIISQLLMNKLFEDAENAILKLKKIFKENFALEIQPNNMKRGSTHFNDEIDQVFLNRQLINFGNKHNIKVVATCNTHYVNKEDYETHDVLLAIGSHMPAYSNFRLKYTVPDFYLKSGDEIKTFFSRNYGEEQAEIFVQNSVYFADMCENPDWIDPKHSNPSGKELPIFPVKEEPDYNDFIYWLSTQSDQIKSLTEDKAYLRFKCYTKFDELKKLNQYYVENEKIYIERINEELEVLEFQNFSSYLLIVADYVNWCIKNNIPVGPGRGSAGGCLLAFLLNIHRADSIKYDLLFARFQNKLRTAAPDIDQDVSTIYRDKVIQYVVSKYGEQNVCSISNFNTVTPKVYVRDISRSLELGGSKEEAVKIGNMLADSISADIKTDDINIIINKAPIFGEYCKKYDKVVKYSKILDKPRAMSKHAAGIIIGQRPLVGLVPLRLDKDRNWVIEYEKNNTEENSLVKMDLLGISNLDDIANTITLIKKNGKAFNNEHEDYDANDEATYDLISKGNTFRVFQFGTSGGTIDLCMKIKPKNMDDLAIITTLARPAASDIRTAFIETRAGKRQYSLSHPLLEGAFKKTFGFGLFDESILKIGLDVAGWNLNSADRIRKMIKDKGKHPEKDAKLREEFIQSAMTNKGLSEGVAAAIWDNEVKKFGGYTFNRSHAIMYSMISYQTAYLKAHFPIEFLLVNLMAQVKSNAPHAKEDVEKIKKELKSHKVQIVRPDINYSELTYTMDHDKLITGLDAIKFVSDDAIKDIIEKRPFKNFFDFMIRVSSKKVRANTIQALAAVGALDSFGISRKLIFLYVADYRKKLQVWLKKHDPNIETFNYPWANEKEWSISELYALEQFYIGEAFICKPIDAYNDFFKKKDHDVFTSVKKAKDKTTFTSLKAIVISFFELKVKKETSKYYGQSMVKAVFEDKNRDLCTCTIFPDNWKMLQERIHQIHSKIKFDVGIALHFSATSNNYEDDIGLILNNLYNIALPPVVPTDLKAKKISLRELKQDVIEPTNENSEEIIEKIEDSLYNEGLLDFDEDDEN